MAKKTKTKGLSVFEDYYHEVWQERWEVLRGALQKPVEHIARINSFSDEEEIKKLKNSDIHNCQGVRYLAHQNFPTSNIGVSGLQKYYFMDLASIFPVLALDPKPSEKILDMCAAPGGKTLIIFELMRGQGKLVANEMAADRRARLKRVICDYVPNECQKSIQVTSYDASRWGLYEKCAYDRILLDAPCSSERHLLHSEKHMADWSLSRSKNLSKRQYALLLSGLMALKSGGVLVYTTCAISPLENDAVIDRVKDKMGDQITIEKKSWSIGDSTDNGWIILPDKTNAGPIYFSILRKMALTKEPEPSQWLD